VAFYKVKKDRNIQLSGVVYNPGQVVQLTDVQAAYHASSVELTAFPQESDSVFNFDFVWNNGAPFSAIIDQPSAQLDVKAVTPGNPLLIEFNYPHGLSTGELVNVYALSGSNAVIDGSYAITVIDSTKITVPLNASAYVLSETCVEIPSNQTGVNYTATVYNPATTTKTIADDSSATTINTSRKVEISKNIVSYVYPGDLLTVEGAVTGILVNAVEPTGLVIATAATASLVAAPWWVTRDVLDYEAIGTSLTTLTASVDTNTARLTLSRAWLSGMSNGVYPYRIYSTLSGVSNLLYKGTITVKS
jgi:hypothetical protein